MPCQNTRGLLESGCRRASPQSQSGCLASSDNAKTDDFKGEQERFYQCSQWNRPSIGGSGPHQICCLLVIQRENRKRRQMPEFEETVGDPLYALRSHSITEKCHSLLRNRVLLSWRQLLRKHPLGHQVDSSRIPTSSHSIHRIDGRHRHVPTISNRKLIRRHLRNPFKMGTRKQIKYDQSRRCHSRWVLGTRYTHSSA